MTSTSPAPALNVLYEIPDLGFATVIGFTSAEGLKLAETFLFGRLSGARLPHNRQTSADGGPEPTILIDIRQTGATRAWISFHGAIESPQYQVDLDGFHWDFSKIINTLVIESAIGSALLPVHAASLEAGGDLGLFPGASGAGKSSISYTALTQGVAVHASELAFVRGCRQVCGNSALTIDAAAVALFDLDALPTPEQRDGTRASFPLPSTGGLPITRLVFPQVHPGAMEVRSITSRRARMLLFENVMTQLPLVQLLAQETWPIWRPPDRDAIERVMEEITTLSLLDPVVATGHPRHIVEAWSAGQLG